MNKKPFHEAVAERIIAQLKQGTAPWQRPWEPGAPNSFIPMNPNTGKRYRGINALALMAQGYKDPRWMTYKQAEAENAQVRKGEKGSAIQYWKFTEEQIKKNEQDKPVLDIHGKPVTVEIRLERPRIFYATVFNAEQIEGLPPLTQPEHNWNSIERAEHILSASGAVIKHGESNRAFYRPATDSIHLPEKSQFLSADKYYATALHELGHWSGHSTRMNRELIHPFGSEGYAKEELRAEITSMILGDELGIGHDPEQHASYVGSWIKALQDDPLEIFRAAADAEKMQQFILAFENQLEQTMEYNQQKNTVELPSESELDQEIALLNEVQKAHQIAFIRKKEEGEKIWLNIPFKQKEVVKELAGVLPDGKKAIAWDKEHSRWFAHPGANLEVLNPWIIRHNQDTALNTQETSQIAKEKTWLSVPFTQRDAVKFIAGTLEDGKKAVEWDKAAKCWFAHIGTNLEPLNPWLLSTNIERQQPALTPEQEFSDILKSLGSIVTGEHPIMDGKKHRICVEGDKKGEQSGFYVGHLDGHPAGYVKNNRTGIETKWKSKGYSLTDDERATLHALAASKIQERTEAQKQDQEEAAQRVSKQLSDLILITVQTPYLQTKKIEPNSEIFTDVKGETTYIPAIDAKGTLWSMQYIQKDGTKRFAKNSRKEGCFHALGGLNAIAEAPALVIAEGFATASSISQELGFATISAFDAGNLEPVARALQEQFPDKPIFIMGDDDKHLEITQGINPGKTKAIEAARAVNGVALFPIFAPGEQERDPKSFSDFNDLASKSVLGSEGVKRQVKSIVDKIIQHQVAPAMEHKEIKRPRYQHSA